MSLHKVYLLPLSLLILISLNIFAAEIPIDEPKKSKKVFTTYLNILQKNLNGMIEFRKRSITFYRQAIKKINNKKSLSAADVLELQEIAYQRKFYRNILVSIVNNYETFIEEYPAKYYYKGARRWAFRRSFLYAAALYLLDDNYLSEAVFYQSNQKLRQLSNRANKTFHLKSGEGLQLSAEIYRSSRYAEKRDDVRDIILEAKKWYNGYFTKTPQMEFLWTLLSSSFSYKRIENLNDFDFFTNQIDRVATQKIFSNWQTFDFFDSLDDEFIYNLAYGFGNSIAQIQWEKGSMYNNSHIKKDLAQTLRPGDLLWDRTNNKVSGRIISLTGFWNHNAIYLGTEKELKELGIWNHPKIQPLQEEISQGKVILEALGKGVVLNTIEHFMNIDSIAIAERSNITDEKRKQAVLNAAGHYGKKYNFTFDIESQETLICSQLVTTAYPEVTWKKTRMIGHWTNNPDLTGKETIGPDKTFNLKLMYYEGKKVNSNFEKHMQNLIKNRETKL